MSDGGTGVPDLDQLVEALVDAGDAHHDYEQNELAGERDEQWAEYYADFVLGRLGPFTTPIRLAQLLAEVDDPDDWALAAARRVCAALLAG